MSNSAGTPWSEVVPMVAGNIIGAVTGFAIWMTTDLFVFFPVFIGIGFVLGMVFKEANDRRDKD
jgi:hypothetical protein